MTDYKSHPDEIAALMRAETVKRVDMFGVLTDTYATEAELNGFRPEQGALFATDDLKSPWRRPPHHTDKFQGKML